MDDNEPQVIGVHRNAIEYLTREVDRRGKVIEAAQIWRQYLDQEFEGGNRRDATRRLKNAIDEYTRETLSQQYHP